LYSCELDCQPPTNRYECNWLTWQCVIDPFGSYSSYWDCISFSMCYF
jgi:hypothetical protein